VKLSPLSLMESADRVLNKATHSMCDAGARFIRSRSNQSRHHFMIVRAIGGVPPSARGIPVLLNQPGYAPAAMAAGV
jgi:hypothetical protein